MGELSGYLTAKLAEKTEIYDDCLIEEINRSIQPPRPVGAGDVYIRAMYIVSDQVNGQGGRFADDELDHLTTLLVDSPVMVGHQRDSLPVARTFKAVRVLIDGRTWIKSYFYWMKNSEGAEDLRNNIDGGIYKECSISFLFEFPECSICGQDIRKCRHVPLQEYEIESGQKTVAHFTYRNIIRVLETSLVFRGAVPDTKITDRLGSDDPEGRILGEARTAAHFFKAPPGADVTDGDKGYGQAPLIFHEAASFVPAGAGLSPAMLPYQPGCVIRVVKRDRETELQSPLALPEMVQQYFAEVLSTSSSEDFIADVLVYAVKGNERLNGFGLLQALASNAHIHRLRLRLCDLLEIDGQSQLQLPYRERVKKLKAVVGRADDDRPGTKLTCIRHGDDWSNRQWGQECANYRFGLEIITDEGGGRLARHILTARPLTPVSIHTAAVLNNRHIRCAVEPIGQVSSPIDIICPRSLGVEENAVVVVETGELTSKRKNRITPLVDILPGLAARLTASPEAGIGTTGASLHITQGNDCLRLLFLCRGVRQTATIHHFSPQLFTRGRRFIADVGPSDECPAGLSGGVSIPLEAVTGTGRLIHLSMRECHALFGQNRDLWLRPLLIDGRERYLFSGDVFTDLPEELSGGG